MQVFDLSEISAETMGRMTSTWEEMDWAYGRKGEYGLPLGSISLWAGEPGIGKTRLLVEMMKRLDSLVEPPKSSMIFQGEISPGRFKGEKIRDFTPRGNIWVSTEVAIDEQVAAIAHFKPDLVITDSVQQIEEYRGGRGAKEIVRKIRDVIERTGTHVIFISQLTQRGLAKGGTNLPHEVDVECYLTKASEYTPGLFVFNVEKNRFGKTGGEVVFSHQDWGVECQSQNRFSDSDTGLSRPVVTALKTPRGWFRKLLFGNED